MTLESVLEEVVVELGSLGDINLLF